ncbi:MAG TPA: hypothetical protein VFH36_06850 [Acidimicrobiales bacterium]|jgi:hypothetical protein|nr:hypothetical protein [Acidimicrobiales bacterium]
MSTPSADDLATAVENTVYTAVGLGILGYQHLQVQRRELQRYLSATARLVSEQVERAVSR